MGLKSFRSVKQAKLFRLNKRTHSSVNCEWKFPIHRYFFCRNLQQQTPTPHTAAQNRRNESCEPSHLSECIRKKPRLFCCVETSTSLPLSAISAQLVPVTNFELSNGGKPNSKIRVKIIGLSIRIST